MESPGLSHEINDIDNYLKLIQAVTALAGIHLDVPYLQMNYIQTQLSEFLPQFTLTWQNREAWLGAVMLRQAAKFAAAKSVRMYIVQYIVQQDMEFPVKVTIILVVTVNSFEPQ